MQIVDDQGRPVNNQSSKRILAGVLAIVIGPLGIHKFILGYIKEGVILLVLTFILGVIICGIATWAAAIITLVEGIVYLTKSDENFINEYQINKKPWF